ncbi:RTX toxin [Yersinia aleksiciae]|uniref:RTX toxin n=1 Tax=Yersinia aleksiciae TaxID=263819 RepID=UPI002E0E10C2|nr:RTX toxin [Yersinia aleksiciae]
MPLVPEHSFKFDQSRDLLDKIKLSLYEIGYFSVTSGNKKAAKEFHEGLCYALSAQFMIAERNYGAGGGKQYFDWLNTAIESYKKNAQITNSNPGDIQKKLLMQFHRQFLYTELERIQKMQYSQDVSNNYLNVRNDFGNLPRSIRNDTDNETRINVFSFAQEVKEKSVSGRISNNNLMNIIEKYLSGKNNNVKESINNARKNGKNKSYFIDSIVNKLVEAHNDKNSVYNSKGQRIEMPSEEVKSTAFGEILKVAIDNESIRANSEYAGILLSDGLIISDPDRSVDNRHIKMKEDFSSSYEKLNLLIDGLSDVKNNSYISIMSPNHAMAISITLDENNKNHWTFFDPNIGAKTYDNHADFRQGIYDIFNKHVGITKLGAAYGFDKKHFENMDFQVEYIKFEDEIRTSQAESTWKLARDGEQSYIIRALKENNITFNVTPEVTARVIDFSVDQEMSVNQKIADSWQVKKIVMEITTDGTRFNVHMNASSFDNALTALKPNIDMLLNYKNDNPLVIDIDFNHNVVKELVVSTKPIPSKKNSEIPDYHIELETLNTRSRDVIKILDRLVSKELSLGDLSENTRKSLVEFLGHDDTDSTNRKVIKAMTDVDYYLKLRLELSELQQVSVNNPEFEKLKASEALKISRQWHAEKIDKGLSLSSLASKNDASEVSNINQVLTLSPDAGRARQNKTNLGFLYLHSAYKGKLGQLKDTLSGYMELNYLKSKGLTTTNENLQLDEFNVAFSDLDELIDSDVYNSISEGDAYRRIDLSKLGCYQLITDDTVLNISIEDDNGKNLCRIYDAEAGEVIFRDINLTESNEKIHSLIEKYIRSNSKENSQIKYKLYSIKSPIDLGDGYGLNNIYHQSIITERQRLVEQGTTFFNDQKIAFSTLYDMGATLNSKLISVDAILSTPDWQQKIRFDPLLLNEFYTFPDSTSTEQKQSVQVMKKILDNVDDNSNILLNSHRDPSTVNEIKKRLVTIKSSVDSEGKVNSNLWKRLELTTAQSNRFQSYGQKIGAGTQAIAMTTLVISTIAMAKKLSDPNITDEERTEIRNQLAISWSSVATDFGTDLMQPTFFKMHNYISKKLLSGMHSGVGRAGYKVAAKFTKFAGPVLNIASAGFDIYDAIDNFTKAGTEKNVDLKTDYIVNASLSTIGAAVSVLTATALFVGLSTAGFFGIAIGAGIMLAGMIYNAVRQVKYIKSKISLSGWEEFKTGARLAFNLEPEQDIIQRLEDHNKEELRLSIEQYINDSFNNRIKPLGSNNYRHVNESLALIPVKKYVFVYKVDSKYIDFEQLRFEKVNGSRYISDRKMEFLYSKGFSRGDMDRYALMRYARIPLSEDELTRWKKNVNIDDFEIIELDSIALSSQIEQDNAIILNDEIFHNHNEVVLKKDIWLDNRSKTDTIILGDNDSKDLNTHFNLGGGDDLAIGYKDHRNSFDVTKGQKIFIGGNKEDVFYLMNDVEASVHRAPSFLDGQSGSDTIVAMGLRFSPEGYLINLADGYVKYKNDNLKLAYVRNIRNAYGQSGTDDTIIGDGNINHLNGGGGGGYDILEGRGGNDFLALQRGRAVGGAGLDSYVILPAEDELIDIVISEFGLEEVSAILLPYKAEDIESILLDGNDVVIRLNQNNDYQGSIRLKDVYCPREEGEDKVLSHNYIIYTSDKLVLLPDWPQSLDSNVNKLPSSLKMNASYNATFDRMENKRYFDGSFMKKKVIISEKGDGSDIIIVDGDNINLPPFIRALRNGNPLTNNTIFGAINIHNFENIGSGDFVQPNKGKSKFTVPHVQLSDEERDQDNRLVIDYAETKGDSEVEIVLGDVSGYDLRIADMPWGGFRISHFDRPDEFLNIDLVHPNLISHKGEIKLITFSDKNDVNFRIENRGEGYKIYPFNPVEIKPTDSNDSIIVPKDYRLINNSIDLLDGDDIIKDLSGLGNIISGGLGNDIIYVSSGDNTLIAGQGNDILMGGSGRDTLIASIGNNQLEGGGNDDIYIIGKGKGKTTIRDEHGRNIIIIKDVDHKDLRFNASDNQLSIEIRGAENEVIVKNYSNSSNFIFQTDTHQIEAKDLNLLLIEMASEPERPLSGIQDTTSLMFVANRPCPWTIIAA